MSISNHELWSISTQFQPVVLDSHMTFLKPGSLPCNDQSFLKSHMMSTPNEVPTPNEIPTSPNGVPAPNEVHLLTLVYTYLFTDYEDTVQQCIRTNINASSAIHRHDDALQQEIP